jgi:hypothetical protein
MSVKLQSFQNFVEHQFVLQTLESRKTAQRDPHRFLKVGTATTIGYGE